MQMAVIEAPRNLAGLADASSTEFGACEHPVVGLMTEWSQGNAKSRREGDIWAARCAWRLCRLI